MDSPENGVLFPINCLIEQHIFITSNARTGAQDPAGDIKKPHGVS
jgi:hypothetical protein